MEKVCNNDIRGLSCCVYRSHGAGSVTYSCNYDGYCDYQLPRDSQEQGKPPDRKQE